MNTSTSFPALGRIVACGLMSSRSRYYTFMDPTRFPPPESKSASIQLPPDAESAGAARRFVDANHDGLDPAVVADAQLLTSEIVSNALQHGRPNITLAVRVALPGIGVTVTDDGAAFPQVPLHPPDSSSPSGRGMLIIDAIASAWGVVPKVPPPGKAVWFELEPAPAKHLSPDSLSKPEV
jgi:anti-sigma regulatory factor (Ser/Thr protein kinase)